MKRDPSTNDPSEDLSEQYKDERTEKKIHEHLSNKDDVITEEDIANAPVGIVHKNDEGHVDSKADSAEQEKLKDNDDPDIDTTWNILES